MKINKKILYPILIALALVIGVGGFYYYNKTNKPQAEYDYYSKASQLLNEKRYSESLVEFQKAVNYDNDNIDAHLGIVEIYETKGRANEALEALDRAEEMIGADSRIYEARARIYENLLGDYQKALESYKKTSKKDLRLAKLQIKAGDIDGAKSTLDQMQKGSEKYAESRLLLAFIFASKWDEAYKYVKDDLDNYTTPEVEANYIKMRDLLKKGIEEGDEIRPSTNTQLGVLILKAGYPNLSVPVLEEVTKLLDEYWAGHLFLGTAYLELDEIDKATEEFKTAIDRDPTAYQAYALLGRIYADQNDQQNALKMYERSLELHPDNESLLYEYAGVLRDFGIYTKAEVVYKGLDKYKGDNWIDYRLDLVDLYINDLKNYEKARKLCENIVDEWDGFENASPSVRARIYDYYAWSYYKLGDPDKTEDLLNKAYEEYPYSPTVHYHLGIIFQDLQNLEQARKYYERAIDLDTEGVVTEDAKKKLESL